MLNSIKPRTLDRRKSRERHRLRPAEKTTQSQLVSREALIAEEAFWPKDRDARLLPARRQDPHLDRASPDVGNAVRIIALRIGNLFSF
jgi:hypothetical protein